MSLAGFLQRLQQQGVTLSCEGDELKVKAKKGALTEAFRNELVTNKTAIVAWLKERDHEEAALPLCTPDVENLYQPFPLSDLQFGFYMASDPYMEFHVRPHYYMEKNVDGLDVACYEAAWNRALRRHAHEINIVRADGQQAVVKNLQALQIDVVDLHDKNSAERQAVLSALRDKMMRSELPVDRWPWVDLKVSLWSEAGVEKARIHYNHNNFFSDGYGTTRLLQEIDLYYREPQQQLPDISLSFRDAAIALDELALSDQGQTARRYWEERLINLPGPPTLPVRAAMERRCRAKLQRRDHQLSPSIWQSFKQHAKALGITPSNAVFSAYAEVLSAWSNSRHFVLSNMMTRRLNIHPEIFDIIGNFASLYPLEVDLRQGESFAERAQQIQDQVMRDAQYLQWGGMPVMQALNRLSGDVGVSPIPFVIGSGLFMDNYERADFSCLETSQVMLDHQFWELSDGSFYYVWDLLEEFFPEGLIDAMWQAYAALIEKLASHADSWQSKAFSLVPLSVLEQRAAVTPVSEQLSDQRLEMLLENSVSANPEALALNACNETLNYGELNRGSHAIATQLQNRDVAPGDRVAIIANRGAALLQAVYGVLKAGAVYIPVDPSLPPERRNYLLKNSDAHVVLIEAIYSDSYTFPEGVEAIKIDAKSEPAQAGVTPLRDDELAYIIYTSGSTGQPKGVMIDHRGAVNTVLDVNQRFSITAEDKLFGVSSFGFDLSVYDIFGSAAAGAALIYPDPDQALNPAHWLDLLGTQGVTVWNSAPPLAQLMVEAAEFRHMTLPALRLVLLSGDWIPLDLPSRLRAVAPNVRVVSLGGATEASIWSICYEIDGLDSEWPSIPYGYPMKNQLWYILDELGRPTPDWSAGDLYIGGVGLARGYWHDTEKSQGSFVRHPETGARIYRTGDVGRYRPGGIIEFLGRSDHQVKIQGHRIELGEIETVLCTHPSVSKALAAVQKVEDRLPQLVVYIVRAAAAKENETFASLREYLAERLPAYMLPNACQFLPDFPLNSNGKVDRKALPVITDQLPQQQTLLGRAPQGEVELMLLTLWQTVLGREEISATDDFFELGGQSFEAVQLVGLIRETLGDTLSLGDVWQARTLEKLARRINSSTLKKEQSHLISLDHRGKGTPLFLVHPAGGNVICYAELSAQLNRPVFAFQAPGSNGLDVPLSSVNAFVECYLAEFQHLDWRGEIYLGGWSSGAPIAFALASRLRESNWTVRGVVVIDSPAPLVHGPVDDQTMSNWFAGDLNLPAHVVNRFEALNGATLMEDQRLKILHQLMDDPLFNMNQLSDIYQVFKGIVTATRAYQPGMIGDAMLSIRAQDGIVSEFVKHPFSARGDWGWHELTSGTVHSEIAAGSHYTVLQKKYVGAVAFAIEQWISKLNQANSKAGIAKAMRVEGVMQA